MNSEGGGPPTYYNYVIQNGNTVISYMYQPGGSSVPTTTDTTYYTFLTDVDNRNYGMPFLGKTNVNLINTDTTYSTS